MLAGMDLAGELAEERCVDIGGAAERILTGISSLLERAAVLVIVSNDVFGSGERYDEGTMAYIRTLGGLHRELSGAAAQVAEVVCGIPVYHKT